MDLSYLSGFVLIVVGAVVFAMTVMLTGFWASEAAVEAIKRRAQDRFNSVKHSLPNLLVRRRKAA